MAVGIAKMLYDNTGVYEKTISKRRHRFDRLTGIKEATTGYMTQKPANIGLRSQYALHLYGWAKKPLGPEPCAFRWKTFYAKSRLKQDLIDLLGVWYA